MAIVPPVIQCHGLGARERVLRVHVLVYLAVGVEVAQDLAILEHKKHLEKPLLCSGDGDILRWRRYTHRFYSETVG